MSEPKDDPPASPFVYLGNEPTPEEHQLAQQLGRHDGDSVPFHMFAKVAVRLHKLAAHLSGFEWFWRRARRHARTALVALAGNLVVIGGFVLHRVAEEAAAKEHAAMQEQAEIVYRAGVARQLDTMERQLSELRSALMRLGVNLPQEPAGGGSDLSFPHDKFSSVLPGVDPGIGGRQPGIDVAAGPERAERAAFQDVAGTALEVRAADVVAGQRMWVDLLGVRGLTAGPQCHAQDSGEDDAHGSVVHHAGAAAAISAPLR